MHRSKLGLLSLCALALGLMAFASSAQAAEWLILNSKNEVKTAFQLPASLEAALENNMGTLLTQIAGISVSLLCTGVNFSNLLLQSGGGLSAGLTTTFTGCTIAAPSGCQVKSKGGTIGTVVSTKLKGKAESSGEVKVEPETAGGAIFELIFSGATCTLPTEVTEPIKGVIWWKDCEKRVTEHLEKHLWEESTAHGKTLFIGSDTEEHLQTSFDGSILVKLSGAHLGLKWGLDVP
jgi:hypothetical protein